MSVSEKPSMQQMKRLREMYQRGEITIEELLERVRVGRFDHKHEEIMEKHNEYLKELETSVV